MRYLLAGCIVLVSFVTAALGASGRQQAPPGSFEGAPPQFTHFTAAELSKGFLALAFGSDLRIGARPLGIRRFDRPIRARVIGGGSVDRTIAMSRVIQEYARDVPALGLAFATSAAAPDIEVRLIDEKDFQSALQEAFGSKVARDFVSRTDVQKQFETLGLTTANAAERVNAMTQDEINRIAGKIDTLPAGADSSTGWWIAGIIIVGVIIWYFWK